MWLSCPACGDGQIVFESMDDGEEATCPDCGTRFRLRIRLEPVEDEEPHD